MSEHASGVRQPRFMGDLSHLPTHGFSHRSLTWWGMMGMIAVEGTVFVLAAASYLYLSNHSQLWPPHQIPPTPFWGTMFTIVAFVSFVPNMWLNKAASKERLKQTQLALIVMDLFGFALLAIRYLEFTTLNVAWSDSAYGSIVVVILGLHTAHLVTDLIDSLVLTVLMFTRHVSGRRFVDSSENAIYWNFVVFAWLPFYALIYWAPRAL